MKRPNITHSIQRLQNIFNVVCITLVVCACNQIENTPKVKTQALQPVAKSQVVLKTQPTDYNPESPSQELEDYVNKKKVTIPPVLSAQNKWIMFEGPVLENDKVAYRYYADKRHRFDIYGKKVSDLVMDTVSWDYHKIMDWGSDILKVGNSLGIGSPAILYQDSIYCLENWTEKDIEIIQSGDDNSLVRTTFTGLKIGDESMTIQQDWSLAAGNYYSTIKINRTDGNLPEGMRFATGIVKHLEEYTVEQKGWNFSIYTWGKQSFHKQNLGMGIFSDTAYGPRYYENNLSHVIAFDESRQGIQYQFISVWADGIGNIDTEEKFKKELNNSIEKLNK